MGTCRFLGLGNARRTDRPLKSHGDVMCAMGPANMCLHQKHFVSSTTFLSVAVEPYDVELVQKHRDVSLWIPSVQIASGIGGRIGSERNPGNGMEKNDKEIEKDQKGKSADGLSRSELNEIQGLQYGIHASH